MDGCGELHLAPLDLDRHVAVGADLSQYLLKDSMLGLGLVKDGRDWESRGLSTLLTSFNHGLSDILVNDFGGTMVVRRF
jgi:hypothetical protein